MRSKPIVALIYDFDGTLSPGNMQEFGFIQAIGKKPQEFWQESDDIAATKQAKVLVEEAQFYSNIYLTSLDGSVKLRLYTSSASQYNWLKAYNGQTITVEVAACNWNDKNYYTGCVLAVVLEDGSKVYNTLNFSN